MTGSTDTFENQEQIETIKQLNCKVSLPKYLKYNLNIFNKNKINSKFFITMLSLES